MSRPLSIVTVVFDAEIPLLHLQARSIARYLEPGSVDEIIVIDNCLTGLSRGQRQRLQRRYGPLGDRVRVVRTRELADVRGVNGWYGQQVAKLAVATSITSRHYVVLDAKNHLIRAAGLSDFVGPDGRAHGASHTYVGHPLRQQLAATLRYLGATADEIEDATTSFPPTATPFVIDTQLARELIDDIERRSSRPFDDEFVRSGLLEFFLYSGWVIFRGPGWDTATDGVRLPSPTVWPAAATLQGVTQAAADARKTDSAVFAVHRQALFRAERDAREQIAGFWSQHGLFPEPESALRWIARFRVRYLPTMALTRGSEKVLALMRRAGRRGR